jgi:hypothetical protein
VFPSLLQTVAETVALENTVAVFSANPIKPTNGVNGSNTTGGDGGVGGGGGGGLAGTRRGGEAQQLNRGTCSSHITIDATSGTTATATSKKWAQVGFNSGLAKLCVCMCMCVCVVCDRRSGL